MIRNVPLQRLSPDQLSGIVEYKIKLLAQADHVGAVMLGGHIDRLVSHIASLESELGVHRRFVEEVDAYLKSVAYAAPEVAHIHVDRLQRAHAVVTTPIATSVPSSAQIHDDQSNTSGLTVA